MIITQAKKRMIKVAQIILIVGLSLITVFPVLADVLTLNNGDEIFGLVQKADPKHVELEKDGKTLSFVATQVMKLEFEAYRMIPDEKTVEAIRDPLIVEAVKNPVTSEKYPEALRVDLLDEDRFDLAADGTWTHQKHDAFVVLKEAARDEANRSFTYFPDLESFDISYGRSIMPPSGSGLFGLMGKNSGSVRYVSDRTIADEADFAGTPLYSRRHTVKFAIPEVNEETIVDTMYQVKRKKDDPFKPFFVEKYFRGGEPIKLARLIISLPKTMKLLFSVEERGVPIQVEHREEGDRMIHVFTASETLSILDEPLMPGLPRMAPRVLCSLENAWDKVAGRYATALDGIKQRNLNNPTLKAVVDKVAGSEKDPGKKTRLLFEYVAREVSRLGISPGAFSHEPIDPAKVLEARQGTLFDKGFLYHVLLTIAGIESRLLLVCPVENGEWCYELPNLRQATDMAVEVPGVSGALSMNIPLNEYLNPDVCPTFLQGAKGIRLPNGDPVAIANASPESEGEFQKMDAEIRDDGTLMFQETTRVFGNSELSLRSLKALRQEEIHKIFQEFYHGNFPGAVLKKIDILNLQDIDKPMEVRSEVEIPGFALKSGNDLLVIPVPVPKNDYSASSVGASVRREAMAWPTLSREEKEISLKLPSGYTAYALPLGSFGAASGMAYHSAFGFELGKVLFHDVAVRWARDLKAGDYQSYKKYVEERSKTTDQWIIIRKNP